MIRKFGAFSEAVTKKYAKQILEGLEYLHTNHIVHRDIKGANILVDEKGNCKLADFGSAKMNVIFYEQQQYNSIKGTINFMAPEVIKQKGSGRYADIWSLGCTVYEMLTGSPPWSQYQNQIYALMQIASSKQGPQIPSNLSSESKDFLSKCFQIEPKKRWNVYKLLRHPFIKNQLDDQISSQQQNYAHGMHKATSITQSQLMMLNKLEERAQQKILDSENLNHRKIQTQIDLNEKDQQPISNFKPQINIKQQFNKETEQITNDSSQLKQSSLKKTTKLIVEQQNSKELNSPSKNIVDQNNFIENQTINSQKDNNLKQERKANTIEQSIKANLKQDDMIFLTNVGTEQNENEEIIGIMSNKKKSQDPTPKATSKAVNPKKQSEDSNPKKIAKKTSQSQMFVKKNQVIQAFQDQYNHQTLLPFLEQMNGNQVEKSNQEQQNGIYKSNFCKDLAQSYNLNDFITMSDNPAVIDDFEEIKNSEQQQQGAKLKITPQEELRAIKDNQFSQLMPFNEVQTKQKNNKQKTPKHSKKQHNKPEIRLNQVYTNQINISQSGENMITSQNKTDNQASKNPLLQQCQNDAFTQNDDKSSSKQKPALTFENLQLLKEY